MEAELKSTNSFKKIQVFAIMIRNSCPAKLLERRETIESNFPFNWEGIKKIKLLNRPRNLQKSHFWTLQFSWRFAPRWFCSFPTIPWCLCSRRGCSDWLWCPGWEGSRWNCEGQPRVGSGQFPSSPLQIVMLNWRIRRQERKLFLRQNPKRDLKDWFCIEPKSKETFSPE